MLYETQFAAFVRDKRAFFAEVTSLNEAKERASNEEHNYSFVGTNEGLIREEFNLLFNRLKQEDINQDIFWFYCYYCCIMLHNYHRAYGQKAKAEEFLILRKQIKRRCVEGQLPSDYKANETFLTRLSKIITASLMDWVRTPTEVSKIRDKIAFANISRIYWFFCRTVVSRSLVLARDIQWIDRIGSVLGKKIDVDAIIKTLEKPNPVLRFLSVGLFASRFAINTSMIVKHVLFPSEEESQLIWYKRLGNELYKRHPEMLNDMVWGVVNVFTNYNEVFGLTAPTANWIIAAFLFFDFSLFLWRRYLAELEYEIKRAQLCSDRNYYDHLIRQDNDPQREMHQQQFRLLTKEIKQLDIKWKAIGKTFWFNASAALLLVMSFSTSMILSPPVLVLICYILCTFAVAMYLSQGAYTNYKEKRLLLGDARTEGLNYRQHLADFNKARNDYYFTLAENFMMPAFVLGVYTVCWQAGLMITVLHFAHKLYSSASSQTPALEKEQRGEPREAAKETARVDEQNDEQNQALSL